jgi:peptide/nickel transport system substrate-binding protein
MKRLTKATMVTVAMAGSMTMLLAGCGNTATNNTTNKAGNATNTTANQPVDGGTMTIGQGTKFNAQFLPDMAGSLYTANISGFAFDPLLTIDKNLNFIPDLAKSWSWSADKKTLTMKLADANWSDGQPITSDDVLYTLDYLDSKAYAGPLQGQYQYLVSAIKGSDQTGKGTDVSFAKSGGFTKIDDKTFSLTFNAVDAAVLWSMISNIQPIPKHVLDSTPMKDWGTSAFDKTPNVVSGPYVFQNVTSSSVTMQANPNYFMGKPHISTVVWQTVSPDVAPGELASGKLTFMMNGLKPQDVAKLKQLTNINVKTLPEMGFSYLGLKFYQKEFQDVRVRQAFEYALNRKQDIQGILKGLGTPINGPLPAASWAAASTSDGMNPYSYDPTKAGQLLDQAGWTVQPDGWRKDPVTGKDANLTIDFSSGSPTTQAEAVAIQQDLEKVHVKITLNAPLDFNTLVKKVEGDDKNLYMWLMGWSLSIDPDPRGLWDSTDPYNFPRWKDPHNDALIKATWDAAAFDKTVRKQAFIQWQLYVNKNLPYVFLWSPDNIWAYSKKLNIPANDWSVAGPLNVNQWWISK